MGPPNSQGLKSRRQLLCLADALASYRSRRALRHLENAGEFNLRWTVQEGVIKPREMTRRLPEGRWNPTKIPRIQFHVRDPFPAQRGWCRISPARRLNWYNQVSPSNRVRRNESVS
jgi:hypothetical protein